MAKSDNITTPKFRAKIHEAKNKNKYLSLSWINKGKVHFKSVLIKEEKHCVEFQGTDEENYLVAYNSEKNIDKVIIFLDCLFSVTKCQVSIK